VRRLRLGLALEAAVLLTILAVGKPVLVPLTLAFYFGFLLTPPSEWLERVGVPRALSLVMAIGAALASFVTLASVLVAQLADLAKQMQTYSAQMSQKVDTLRHGPLGLLTSFSNAFAELGRVLNSQVSSTQEGTLHLAPEPLSVGQQVGALFRLLEPAGLVGVVVVLTIFVLAGREDLRGRLIQLVGPQNVTVTTRTIDEVVKRISHYLLTQSYINAGFASVIALGLYLIGIPYALLWGVIAGLLRFVPLLGALVAVVMPSLVAFAIFPGWSETLMTVALFVAVDITVANFIEPVVLGRRTGVSSLALLVSALFWTWMWGPVGLVLATPLTVCAAVIGRHSAQLSFLTILLGDEPGLNAEINFYQRVLAGAKGDALRIAKHRAKASSITVALDAVVLPAISLMSRDHQQQTIDDAAAERVLTDLNEIVTQLQSQPPVAPAPDSGVIGLAAASEADALLLRMLGQVSPGLNPLALRSALRSREAAAEEVLRHAPRMVCITALPPASSANARFFCRRLRTELPNCRILVLLASVGDKSASETASRLREAGASSVVFGLTEARDALSTMMRGAPVVELKAASSPG